MRPTQTARCAPSLPTHLPLFCRWPRASPSSENEELRSERVSRCAAFARRARRANEVVAAPNGDAKPLVRSPATRCCPWASCHISSDDHASAAPSSPSEIPASLEASRGRWNLCLRPHSAPLRIAHDALDRTRPSDHSPTRRSATSATSARESERPPAGAFAVERAMPPPSSASAAIGAFSNPLQGSTFRA